MMLQKAGNMLRA
jgi:adenylate cyclase